MSDFSEKSDIWLRISMRASHRSTTLYLIPVLLLLLAFAVRTLGLADQSLWYDEGYTVMFAKHELPYIVTQIAHLELNTPLHYVLLHIWMLGAGESEFAARLLSVFVGVITVALVWQIARRISPRSYAGHWAVALAALWPVLVSISQEVRMYALAICLCTLAVLQLLRCWRNPVPRQWLLWAVFCLLAFSAHVLSAWVFGAQIIALVWWWLRQPHQQRSMVVPVTAVISGVGMAVWAVVLLDQARSYGTTYTDRLAYLPIVISSLAGNLLPRGEPLVLILPMAVLCVLLLIAALMGGRVAQRLALIVGINVLLVAAFGAFTGKFASRYATLATPLLVALAGAAVRLPAVQNQRELPVLKIIGGSLAVGLCILGLIALRIDPSYANEDFRGAAAYLRSNVASDETVLLVSGHYAPVYQYYYGEEGWHALPSDAVLDVRNLLTYETVAPELNQALTGKSGAWLLLWQDDLIDPSGIVPAMLRRVAHLLQPVQRINQYHGLRLLHYRFDTPYQALPEKIPTTQSQVQPTGMARGLNSLGCHVFRPALVGESLMEVACFWQLDEGRILPWDLQVSLRLSNDKGVQVTQSDQLLAQPSGMPSMPFTRPLTSFYFIPLPTGFPAGNYTLHVIPYLPDGEVSPQVTTPVQVLEP
jgi:uncharacterized membrane protein